MDEIEEVLGDLSMGFVGALAGGSAADTRACPTGGLAGVSVAITDPME